MFRRNGKQKYRLFGDSQFSQNDPVELIQPANSQAQVAMGMCGENQNIYRLSEKFAKFEMLPKALSAIPPLIPMWIIGVLMLRQIQCDERRRYFCDTKEKIDEIRNIGQHLRRLVRFRDQVYFVLKNRIIYSKLNVDTNETKDDRLFLSLDFYEQQTIEPDSIDHVDDDYRVFGYVYELLPSRIGQVFGIWELYILQDRQNASGTKSLIHNHTHRLEFGEGLAQRAELTTVDGRVMDRLRSCAANANIRYFNLAQVENGSSFTFMAQFREETNDASLSDTGAKRENETSNCNQQSNSSNLLLLDFDWFGSGPKFGNFRPHKIHDQPEWQYFTFYSKNVEMLEGNYMNYMKALVYFVGINSAFRVALIRYEFTMRSTMNRSSMIELEDLLSCHTRYTDPRQIGGIYYNKSKRRFFLFIRRFFVEFNEDLVSSHFHLPTNYDYIEQARPVPISFEKFPFDGDHSPGGSVKTLGASVLYGYGRHFYELIIAQSDNLAFASSKAAAEFSSFQCDVQTLLVERRFVFCFDTTNYSFLYELGEKAPTKNASARLSSIKTIFLGSAVHWWKESLRHIFNYENDTVVFMTESHLFLLEYARFSLSPTDKSQIIYNDSSGALLNETSVQLKNYLYSNREQLPDQIPKPVKGNHLSNLLILVIIFLVALISIVLIRRNRNALKLALSSPLSLNYNSLEAIPSSILKEETDASDSNKLGHLISFKINKRVCDNIQSNFKSNFKSSRKLSEVSNKLKLKTGLPKSIVKEDSLSSTSQIKNYSAAKSVFLADNNTVSANTSLSFDRKSCGSNPVKEETLSQYLVNEEVRPVKPPSAQPKKLRPKGEPLYKSFKL